MTFRLRKEEEAYREMQLKVFGVAPFLMEFNLNSSHRLSLPLVGALIGRSFNLILLQPVFLVVHGCLSEYMIRLMSGEDRGRTVFFSFHHFG
jgi:hypothetical protein